MVLSKNEIEDLLKKGKELNSKLFKDSEVLGVRGDSIESVIDFFENEKFRGSGEKILTKNGWAYYCAKDDVEKDHCFLAPFKEHWPDHKHMDECLIAARYAKSNSFVQYLVLKFGFIDKMDPYFIKENHATILAYFKKSGLSKSDFIREIQYADKRKGAFIIFKKGLKTDIEDVSEMAVYAPNGIDKKHILGVYLLGNVEEKIVEDYLDKL
jgi:hypothetical protein